MGLERSVERSTGSPRPQVVGTLVDVVIVAYNSRDELRATVEPLVDVADVRVVVVDNASPDGGLDTIADLAVTAVQLTSNCGFSAGCNAGFAAGAAPYVLLLNPDARIDVKSLRILVDALEQDDRVGLAGPLIVHADGGIEYSQRRFPRLRSTYARALFLHRLFPRASWADELVREPEAYAAPTSAEWLSGACLLVRRAVLQELGGLDERFFLYCEDQDLCKRVWEAGYEVRFEPRARCVHDGGASAPRASLFPVAAASRVLYARKHARRAARAAERVGLALHAVTHALVSAGGRATRGGHVRSLGALVDPARADVRVTGAK